MKEHNTTRVTIDLSDPPDGGTDWERLAQMTEEEITAAAESDPDCPPLTDEQLARMRRAPDARKMRESLAMTQVEFARTFGLSVGTVRDWEQHRFVPDRAARALLCFIERYPVEAQAAMLPRGHADSAPAPGTLETAPAGEKPGDSAQR